jgi:hypothetical protein
MPKVSESVKLKYWKVRSHVPHYIHKEVIKGAALHTYIKKSSQVPHYIHKEVITGAALQKEVKK